MHLAPKLFCFKPRLCSVFYLREQIHADFEYMQFLYVLLQMLEQGFLCRICVFIQFNNADAQNEAK
jgi:hypothetical protein